MNGLRGAGESDSKVTYSRGCWLEALVPHHVDFLQDCLSVFTVWQLASARPSDPREGAKRRLQYLL